MANGPGEIILLCAGLIVAGLVSGVLLETWDDMDAALEERGKESAADVRTRASLLNDPLNVAWDNAEKTATLYLQNSGENQLDLDTVAVFIASNVMAIQLVRGLSTLQACARA